MPPVTYADSNLVSLRYSTETNWGETPATGPGPTMQDLRFTGETLSYAKKQASSNEIRSDRQVPNILALGVDTTGKIDLELSSQTYDDLLQSVLGGTWQTLNLAGEAFDVHGATHTVQRATGSWITDGVVAGIFIKLGGTGLNAADVGPWRVTNVTATVLTLEDPDSLMVDSIGVTAGTLKARWLRNGVTKRSHLFEVAFTDIGKFLQFTGCRMSQFDLNFQAQAIVTGAFQIMGKLATSSGATVSGAITAKGVTPPFAASADVGQLRSQGVDLTTGIKSVALVFNNALRTRPVVGSAYTADLGYGRIDLKPNLVALVPDLSLFNEVVAHTTISLLLPVTDALGNFFFITIPAFKITGTPDASAGNKDVEISLQGDAQLDAATNCMIQIDTIQ